VDATCATVIWSHSHVPGLSQVQQGTWYSLLPHLVLISYLNPILSVLEKKVLEDATYVLQTAAEIERLRSRINDAAVCKHASSLNGGRSWSGKEPVELPLLHSMMFIYIQPVSCSFDEI
jgi:hypothetical protein